MAFKYMALHDLDYGDTTVRFSSPGDLNSYIGLEDFDAKLAETLGLNVELHKGEFFRVVEEESEVIELTIEQVRELTKDEDAFQTKA